MLFAESTSSLIMWWFKNTLLKILWNQWDQGNHHNEELENSRPQCSSNKLLKLILGEWVNCKGLLKISRKLLIKLLKRYARLLIFRIAAVLKFCKFEDY